MQKWQSHLEQEHTMFKNLTAIASFTALLSFASPVLAQSPTSWVKVGGLSCTMSPTIGLLVVQEQTVNCQFTPHGHYPSEHYTGTIGTVGIAVGVVGGGMLAWAVYMPTQGPSQGSLAGTYGGASGDIDIGIGVGANALWGGSGRSVALQPISVEGSVGLDVTLGVSALTLQWVP
jgi:Protein of unknown function (DUF992)